MSKVVLITGTNSGFGKLTTKLLSEKGYTVYATMRNTDSKNAEAANELGSWDKVTVLDLDVTSKDSVNKAVKDVIDKEGKIDVLINNAGYFTSGVTESFTEEDFDNLLEVNLKGPWRLLRATLPHFRKQNDGLIINISSGLGRFSAPFMTLYNSSKFGLEGLVEGTYFELKNLGIENVILQPGAFPTEIFSKIVNGSDATVVDSYGDLVKIPQQMSDSMAELFKSDMAPDPNLVAENILELIETEKGKRPLRTVVDPLTGKFVEKANDDVYSQLVGFLSAFGMGSLLEN